MPILTSDWLIATEATEAMAVMEVMENTASMDTAEAMDMAGEIVINIWINSMPYLINNDGEFTVSITKQFLNNFVGIIHRNKRDLHTKIKINPCPSHLPAAPVKARMLGLCLA